MLQSFHFYERIRHRDTHNECPCFCSCVCFNPLLPFSYLHPPPHHLFSYSNILENNRIGNYARLTKRLQEAQHLLSKRREAVLYRSGSRTFLNQAG